MTARRDDGDHSHLWRGRLPRVSEIEFQSARRASKPDLIGFACLNVARVVRLLWIEVHRDADRGIRLVYPAEWQPHRANPGILPVAFSRSHKAIVRALCAHLGIEDPSARPRRRGGR